jgi:prepilin-type N-terminal cleavage/methylation domain-containing protein
VTRPNGFTLLEVLAVVLLTALVIGVALDHYVNLTRATRRASNHSLGVRRAVSLLDRMARDFESVILVSKPADLDPESHPWIFAGEQRHSELGADRLKFITLAHRARSSAAHVSDLLTVVYCLRNSEDGESYDLLRWSSPQLPEPGSDLHEMPCDEESGARLLSDSLDDFGVTFLGEAEDTRTWDSTQLVDSGELPRAVQIQLAFAGDLPDGDPDAFEDTPRIYSRTVPIRVLPMDREELHDPDSTVNGGEGIDAGEESEEDVDDDETACEQTRCGGQPVCAVIDCNSLLGQFGEAQDAMIREAQAQGLPFCDFRRQAGTQGAFLIPEDCR